MSLKITLPKSKWLYFHFWAYLAWLFYDVGISLSGSVFVREWVFAKTLSGLLVGLILGLTTSLINHQICIANQVYGTHYFWIVIVTIVSVIFFLVLQSIATLLIFNPFTGG